MDKDIEMTVNTLLDRMSLEEKSMLCMGDSSWTTKAFPQHGIPAVTMTDGTNGLRYSVNQARTDKAAFDGDSSSFFSSVPLSQNSEALDRLCPATCFPSGSAIAASWDRELIEQVASAVAEECHHYNVNLLLGPGITTRRCPLAARSYEYFSEDPVVSGELAAAYVYGLQKNGVGATVKHYTCNNSEFQRTYMDSVVSQRALREIYLAGFERVIKKAHPWCVMSSYNRLNGVQMAENRRLLTDVLRNEFGFDGLVISDWYGIKDRIAAAKAGNELEMPFNHYNIFALSDGVKTGKLSEDELNRMCRRVLEFVFKASDSAKKDFKADFAEHHRVARRASAESMVLLKNRDGVLPVDPSKVKKLAVIGSIAKAPRYQGGGSTLTNPTFLDIPFDKIAERAGSDIEILYAAGYGSDDASSPELLDEARRSAAECDMAVVFAGLHISADNETTDRNTLDIEASHISLIEAVTSVQSKTVVVLCNGEAVTLDPWIDSTAAVLEAFMSGQGGGGAMADVLFGDVDPSGRLPVTYPKRVQDNPAYLEYPGENGEHRYCEDIYVGYRYYDKKAIEPLFPFGYGLSYTAFEYSGLKLSARTISPEETLSVSLSVKNIGTRSGKEVVQLYIADPQSRLRRPEKELKGFEKISLEPGEQKTVSFELCRRDLSYYDPEFSDWVAEPGEFVILVGASSRDIRLKDSVTLIDSAEKKWPRIYADTVISELVKNPIAVKMFMGFLVENGLLSPEDAGEKFVYGLSHSFASVFGIAVCLGQISPLKVSAEKLNAFLEKVNKACGR